MLVTFYNSLHTLRMDLGMQYEWVGLEHFREILTSDDVFWKAARNSLVWAVVAPLVDLPLAFVLALILHARVPFARFFRTVWFTPVLMSYPVVGVIWLWVYNYDWGIANLVLRAIGLGDYAQAWLASPVTALPALILVTTWMFAGFNMVVLLAAMHAIPADYLDAARVDGAGGVAADAADHGAAAVAHHHQPRHPRLHRQDEAVRAGVGDDAGRPHVGHGDGGDLRGQARLRVEDARPRLSVGHRRHLVRDHLRPLAPPHPRPAAPRRAGVLSMSRRLARLLLLVPVLAYTAFSAGPYVWTAMMSLRTTEEIYRSHYGLPIPAHWLKYATAWNEFGYATYFKNSTIVSVASVLIVSVIGSMAGYAFARRRFQFPLREPLFLLIFLSIMFPPQIMLLSLFQILVQYRLFNSLTGLILIYVVTELPLTVYLLRTFFAQIPTELEEAARLDGCGDWATFWRVMFPMALPAVATTVILNFIYFWNEFLYAVIFITQQKIRTLPLAIQFLVSDQYQDVGMLATGLMIATLPVLILYLFLSEWFVKGMTAGAIKG